MNTRRLVALIFNMVATCMNLLVYALFCLLNLVASLSYSRFGGYAFFSFALFGALTTLVVLNIVHFIRHTKNQYNSFDKYSITLGALNIIGYIIIMIFYSLGISQSGIAYSPYSIGSVILGVGVRIIFSIVSIVLSIISLNKEASRFPNA